MHARVIRREWWIHYASRQRHNRRRALKLARPDSISRRVYVSDTDDVAPHIRDPDADQRFRHLLSSSSPSPPSRMPHKRLTVMPTSGVTRSGCCSTRKGRRRDSRACPTHLEACRCRPAFAEYEAPIQRALAARGKPVPVAAFYLDLTFGGTANPDSAQSQCHLDVSRDHSRAHGLRGTPSSTRERPEGRCKQLLRAWRRPISMPTQELHGTGQRGQGVRDDAARRRTCDRRQHACRCRLWTAIEGVDA